MVLGASNSRTEEAEAVQLMSSRGQDELSYMVYYRSPGAIQKTWYNYTHLHAHNEKCKKKVGLGGGGGARSTWEAEASRALYVRDQKTIHNKTHLKKKQNKK